MLHAYSLPPNALVFVMDHLIRIRNLSYLNPGWCLRTEKHWEVDCFVIAAELWFLMRMQNVSRTQHVMKMKRCSKEKDTKDNY